MSPRDEGGHDIFLFYWELQHTWILINEPNNNKNS